MRWKTFVQRIFTEPSGNPSNKRLIATYSVLVYSTVLLVAFFLTFPINDAVLHMADLLLASSLGNYLAGRFAEKAPYSPPIEEQLDPTKKTTPEAPVKKAEDLDEASGG